MRLFQLWWIAIAAAVALPATATAQGILGTLVGQRAKGEVRETKDGRLKIKMFAGRDESVSDAARGAIQALATYAQAKGAPRFAILKESCGTMMMRNIPLNHQCSLTARTLTAEEPAPFIKGKPATVFKVSDVLGAAITPVG